MLVEGHRQLALASLMFLVPLGVGETVQVAANHGLGFFKDDPRRVLLAARYLAEHRKRGASSEF